MAAAVAELDAATASADDDDDDDDDDRVMCDSAAGLGFFLS